MKLKNDKNTEASISTKDKSENENENKSKMYTINMETGNIINFKYLNANEVEDEIKHQNQNSKKTNNPKTENLDQHSTRLLCINKSENDTCGFDLTRTKWDPYPWVSFVEENTPAEISALKVGDCVLEVNGEDVLGLRIADIAKLVKAKSEHVTLLLWSAGGNAKFDTETLCDAPMPHTLQRLSIIVQSILSIIECPVCLETISPPAMQCQNGHLLCVNCRIRSDKCPVCRVHYTPRQALIAEQIYAAITSAFNLCRNEDKLRQKLFGTNVKHPQQQQQQQQEIKSYNMLTMLQDKEIKSNVTTASKVQSKFRVKSNGVSLPSSTNKFLTKLLHSKTCSVDNLSNATSQTQIETTVTTAATMENNACWNLATSSSICNLSNCNQTLNVTTGASDWNISNEPREPTAPTNQLNIETTTSNTSQLNFIRLDDDGILNKKKILQDNDLSKNFSLNTTKNLFEQQIQQKSLGNNQLKNSSLDTIIITPEVCQCKPLKVETQKCTTIFLEKRPQRRYQYYNKNNKCNNLNDSNVITSPNDFSFECSSSLNLSSL